MSEDNKNEQVAQPEKMDPILEQLVNLKEPVPPQLPTRGMKQFTKMQADYLKKKDEYNQQLLIFVEKQAKLLATLSARSSISQQLEKSSYVVPRNAEAVREFIAFITPILEQEENQAKESTDGQEEVSGTPDSAVKE